jgi:ribosome biogenesis protein MAK21
LQLYDGDPLRDLALSVFLDRFIEKKPRAIKADGKFKGASFMQPVRRGEVTRSHLLVGSEAFAAVEENQVSAEDAFFYKFYTAKAAKVRSRCDRSACNRCCSP